MKSVVLGVAIAVGVSSLVAAAGIGEVEKEIVDLVADVSSSIVSVTSVSPHFHSAGQVTPFAPRSRSVGCGIVFDKEGHILTTSTVVGNANEVEIGTCSGRAYRGAVLGTDRVSDVAVVKVENLDLEPARFAVEDDIKPGSLVFVVGNAFGSLPSVSMGVVSAIEKDVDQGVTSLRLAVPISPGDVGGPVVNSQGEVIGIVLGRLTLRSTYGTGRSSRGGSLSLTTLTQPSNLAVAMPSSKLGEICKEIIQKGSIRRGYFGVRVLDLTDEMRERMRNKDIQGVVVVDVMKGSPAESVGIRPGDVITDFNSTPVVSVESLRNQVLDTSPGEVVQIGFRRGATRHNRKVRIANHVPGYLNLPASLQSVSDAEILRSRIEDLKREIRQLQDELKRLDR